MYKQTAGISQVRSPHSHPRAHHGLKIAHPTRTGLFPKARDACCYHHTSSTSSTKSTHKVGEADRATPRVIGELLGADHQRDGGATVAGLVRQRPGCIRIVVERQHLVITHLRRVNAELCPARLDRKGGGRGGGGEGEEGPRGRWKVFTCRVDCLTCPIAACIAPTRASCPPAPERCPGSRRISCRSWFPRDRPATS